MDIVSALVALLGNGAYSQTDAPAYGERRIVTEPAPLLEAVAYHLAASTVTVECYAANRDRALELARQVRDRAWPSAPANGIALHSVTPIAGPSFAARPVAGRLREWRYDMLLDINYSEVPNGN